MVGKQARNLSAVVIGEPEPAEEESADAGYLLLLLNSSFLAQSCTLARRLGSL